MVDAINGPREPRTTSRASRCRRGCGPPSSLEEALSGAELVVFATPSHVIAGGGPEGRARTCSRGTCRSLTVAKGIENDTLLTDDRDASRTCSREHHPYFAVLSGPSFARGGGARAAHGGHRRRAAGRRSAQRCSSASCRRRFRVYTSTDVVGVELGGALKNVIAIAAGSADGLGFGHNARAALITRGLAEITRIAMRMGANPLTLAGLAGMGDLVLTCTGELSRNRQVGFGSARGRSWTRFSARCAGRRGREDRPKSARDLALKLHVELPICEQVYLIVYEGSAQSAVMDLMMRSPKRED